MGKSARQIEREERARRWSQFFNQARANAGLTPHEFVFASGNRFPAGTVACWVSGENVPSAEGAIVVAQVLHVDPVTVLRAAGCDLVADAIEGLISERARLAAVEQSADAPPDPAALFDRLRAQVDDLQAQVRRNESDIEAVGGLAHEQHHALAGTQADVDQVRADVDALASEAGITDRALRGHIDDPRAHEHPDSGY